MKDEHYEFPNSEERINHLDYECEICGSIGEFIFEDLHDWEVNPSDYPDGICINCIRTDDDSFICDENGLLKPGRLTKLNLSKEELAEKIYFVNRGPDNSLFIERINTMFYNSVREEIRRELEPPYSFDNLKVWRHIPTEFDEKNSTIKKDQNEKSTFVEYPNRWLKNLEESFFQFELNILKGKYNRSQSPTRVSYALVCTYLHKSAVFYNIEPVWTFLMRTNLPYKDFQNALQKWHCPMIPSHLEYLNSFGYLRPSKQTLNSLLNVIKNHCDCVDFNQDEFSEIAIYSLEILSKLEEKTIGSTSYLELINSKLSFNKIELCENPIPVIGLIESLCVLYSVNKICGMSKAKTLENYFLFPKSSTRVWWKDKLTTDSLRVIDMFDQLVES